MNRTNIKTNSQQFSFGRKELLDWLNELLGINYQKVEECANGAAFCQIFDLIYPNLIKINKVNFNAINEIEMVSNYKILQEIFNKKKIQKDIPVDILIKGRPMASLEMLQWIKSYFDQNNNNENLDLSLKKIEKSQNKNKSISKLSISKSNIPKPSKSSENQILIQENQKLHKENEELKIESQTLLEERNFYFEKLQRIETLCQDKDNDLFVNEICKILYETDEEHGFVDPD